MRWRSFEGLLVALLVAFAAVSAFFVPWGTVPWSTETRSTGEQGAADGALPSGRARVHGVVRVPDAWQRSAGAAVAILELRWSPGTAARPATLPEPETFVLRATVARFDARNRDWPAPGVLRLRVRPATDPDATVRTRECHLEPGVDRFVVHDVRRRPAPVLRVRIRDAASTIESVQAELEGANDLGEVLPRELGRDFELLGRRGSWQRLHLARALAGGARLHVYAKVDFVQALRRELEVSCELAPLELAGAREGLWLEAVRSDGQLWRVDLSAAEERIRVPVGTWRVGVFERASPNEPAGFRGSFTFEHGPGASRLERDANGSWRQREAR